MNAYDDDLDLTTYQRIVRRQPKFTYSRCRSQSRGTAGFHRRRQRRESAAPRSARETPLELACR